MGNAQEETINTLKFITRKVNLSLSTRESYAGILLNLFSAYPDGGITVDDLNDLINDRLSEGLTAGTHRSVYNWYIKYKGLSGSLLRLKRTGRKKPASTITYKTCLKVLECFTPGVLRDVLYFQIKTGCRQIEAFYLRKKNIVLNPETNIYNIAIVQKGGASSTILFPDTLFMRNLLDKYGHRDYLFFDDNEQKNSRVTLDLRTYDKHRKRYHRAWQDACVKAGLPQYSSHDARRAVLREVMRRFGIYAAQRIARHRRIETTTKYMEGYSMDLVKILKAIEDEE